ncbi:MAG: glycosyltransferase [Fibrobacteria bacterium]|nr:glycosyltransferase [Fibrobacteria bacterium]
MTEPQHPLAIVIPAWKPDFLERTLAGFASQTCKDFRLYIGDDCSPADIEGCVRRHAGTCDVVYHRFEENLGGRNLVQHWRRCIELTQGEPLLWLFSDDDLASPECVDVLLEAWKSAPKADVFHFDLLVVGEADEVLETPSRFPATLGGIEFYRKRRDNELLSFAPEFVFTRRVFERLGFVEFDLAWGSDMFTWINFSGEEGVKSLGRGRVSWRRSTVNISPNTKDLALLRRKILAEVEQIRWIRQFFESHGVPWTFQDEVRAAHAFCRNSLQKMPLARISEWWGFIREAASTSNSLLALPLYILLTVLSAARRRLAPTSRAT